MWMWPFPFECVHCRNTEAGVDAAGKWEGYRKCEEAVREEWEHYRQKNAVGTGSLRPTFELGQMDENPLSVSLGDTVTTFVRDNVTFSRVVVNEYEDPSNIEDETTWQLAFGRLMAGMFDSTRRYPDIKDTRDKRAQPPRLELSRYAVKYVMGYHYCAQR
ncbi:hypothetical protein PI124_g20122 [Phytophthora idaei]|nr:hypothetical protein PI124_g20122 [Phytophthora idaei]